MSPTKPSSAQQRLLRPISITAASAIPRRVKTTSIKSGKLPSAAGPKQKSKSAGDKDSIFHDSTATALPPKVTSYFSQANDGGGENKENIPLSGLARSRNFNLRSTGRSPTRGKTSISKLSKCSPSNLKRSALARRPLRELTEDEIFERDEAALGDLRRRRSGEHSGTYIEFDSHTTATHTARTTSISSSSMTTTSSQSTCPTNLDEDDGKLRVLRRTDSEESLRLKVEAIMAATATASSTSGTMKKFSILRKKLLSPMKLKHPATRDLSPVRLGITTPDLGSPDRKPLSPTKMSPVLARQTASAIIKPSPYPIRPLRMGLGAKSVNTIMKEASNASKENAAKGKKIIISASNATVGNKKTLVKTGHNSLRRAAGSIRPPTTAPSGLKTSLEGIRKMR